MKSTKSYRENDPNVFDKLTRDINEIYDAVNKPQQSVGNGSDGKSGDIRLTKDDGGYSYLEMKADTGWLTSFTGVLVDKPARGRPFPVFPYLEVDNLFAKSFIIQQTTARGGNEVMGAGFGIVESFTTTTITFKDPTNQNLCSFAVNDKCEVRQIKTDKSTNIKLIQFTVTAVSGRTVTVTYSSGTGVSVGDVVVVKGNSSDATRQNAIYFSTSDTNSPYIDLYSGTTGFTFGTPVVRIGKLDGITDSDFGGALSGYGIYTTNAYFKGKIYLANNGSISLGKTAYTDTTNAGFWLGDSDATATVNPYFYLGNAGDTKYLKVDTIAGTFSTLGFTITGGTIQTATSGERIVISGTNKRIDFYDSMGGTNYFDSFANVIRASGDLYAQGAFGCLNSLYNASGKFNVDANGNITKINNITYSFPSVAPTLNQVLTCTNATGGVLSWSAPSGGVTSVASGNGMNFTTITTTGTVTMGTPSSVTGSSTNSTSATSHTHAVSGLGTSNFVSNLISQWSNDSGYMTIATPTGDSPITYNTGNGHIGFNFNTSNTWTNLNAFENLLYTGKASTTNGTVRFYSATNANWTILQAPNATNVRVLELPDASGTLVTIGAANTWTAAQTFSSSTKRTALVITTITANAIDTYSTVEYSFIELNVSGGGTLTYVNYNSGNPTNGTELIITNINATAVTLSEDTTNNGMRLGGASVTLNQWESVHLIYAINGANKRWSKMK